MPCLAYSLPCLCLTLPCLCLALPWRVRWKGWGPQLQTYRLHWKERRKLLLQHPRGTANRKGQRRDTCRRMRVVAAVLQTVGNVQPKEGNSWPANERKLAKTEWQIRPDSTKVIESGCTAQLGTEGSHRTTTRTNDVVYRALRQRWQSFAMAGRSCLSVGGWDRRDEASTADLKACSGR
jgi:hypothetical protein